MEELIIEEIFRENAVATEMECTFKYNFFLFCVIYFATLCVSF